MTIQNIETALRKQLPGKKEANSFLSGSTYDNYKTYFSSDSSKSTTALIIFCGLCRVYINEAPKKVASYYDIVPKEFNHYAALFTSHCDRIGEVIKSYGVNITLPGAYKKFAVAFWHKHNIVSAGEVNKSGIILSHVISSKKEYNHFLKNEDSCLKESDFVSFYIFNKAQLTKNYLTLGAKHKEFVELVSFGY